MIRQKFNLLLASLLLIAGFHFKASSQGIQAEAKLDQVTIRIGDQTKLHLIVYQRPNEHVSFPKLADSLAGKVQIVSSSKPDTLFDKKDRRIDTVSQTYTITCFDAGTYTIPSFSFGTGKNALTTSKLILQVVSVKVDTTKAIYDIKQPLTVSYSVLDWLRDEWITLVVSIIVILLIAGIIYYLKNRPKKAPVVVIPEPVLPIHILILNRLNELREKQLWQQNEIKAYYSELSDLIREYLEKRYDVKTHEKTTEEIFTGLKHRSMVNEDRALLRHILTRADLVKFAKEKPLADENEKTMDDAIAFVLKTQPNEIPGNIKGDDAV